MLTFDNLNLSARWGEGELRKYLWEVSWEKYLKIVSEDSIFKILLKSILHITGRIKVTGDPVPQTSWEAPSTSSHKSWWPYFLLSRYDLSLPVTLTARSLNSIWLQQLYVHNGLYALTHRTFTNITMTTTKNSCPLQGPPAVEGPVPLHYWHHG
jgi:hypothetical protein